MLEDIDMSISENKALVLRAFELLGKRDLPALFALIHEEGSWSVPFDPARFQFGGFRDKAGVMELLTGLDRKSVVEGKRVSVRVDLGGRRIIKKKQTKRYNKY